jgi:cytochrome c6
LPLAFAAALAAAPAARAADGIRGAQIFRSHCATCHGAAGIATLPNAPSFARGDRLMQPDLALAATIRTGRGPMPSFFGILNDKDMLDVVAYIRTLR